MPLLSGASNVMGIHFSTGDEMDVAVVVALLCAQIQYGIERVERTLPHLYQLAQGGTAVGTGLNTKKVHMERQRPNPETYTFKHVGHASLYIWLLRLAGARRSPRSPEGDTP